MRVKIGDTWHEVGPDTPIMVELNDLDRVNISQMPADKTKYACFDRRDGKTDAERLDWME